uniref:Uncharacterized protein n=1 Tax=Cacopsylla melanoneura TaxID=428564 RepID=A0A8D9F2W4_9HEMI
MSLRHKGQRNSIISVLRAQFLKTPSQLPVSNSHFCSFVSSNQQNSKFMTHLYFGIYLPPFTLKYLRAYQGQRPSKASLYCTVHYETDWIQIFLVIFNNNKLMFGQVVHFLLKNLSNYIRPYGRKNRSLLT